MLVGVQREHAGDDPGGALLCLHDQPPSLPPASGDLRIPASCNVLSLPAWHAGGVPLRCLIVDDDAPFLEASRAILEGPEITVVGVASTAAEGLQCAERLTPDVILADIDLGGDSGFELASKLVDGPGPIRR